MTSEKRDLDYLKKHNEAPEWMTQEGYKVLSNGYLLKDETPRGMYTRVAKSAASYNMHKKYESTFFDYMWKNWLCPASPVLSNMGTDRGLPISCNSLHSMDTLDGIFMKVHETAMLSKHGAGVGIYLGDLRARGKDITGNGKCEGVIPWCKVFDSTILSASQGGIRRGAAALYLPIDHGDIEEFLRIRRPVGDMNRQCLNINHAVTISNRWMEECLAGDHKKRELWQELLKTRVETGEPYIMFSDHVNDQAPECYKSRNLRISTSNICCLAGDTEVLVREESTVKSTQIRDLVGSTVEIWDGVEWVENSSFEQKGYDTLYRIHLSGGSHTQETHVDSNANHRWFACSFIGDEFEEILTKDLQVGMWLEPAWVERTDDYYQAGTRFITKIEKLEGEHPVYCPTVSSTGKFALANGLMTGNSEITQYTDPEHTFVCCLCSLNLARWDEWKDSDLPQIATRFLDCVMEEYIENASSKRGLECSVRSAVKGRAIGIGVLGWHSLLQQNGYAFDELRSMMLNAQVFKTIRAGAEIATRELATELGEPEWCEDTGRRNTFCVTAETTVLTRKGHIPIHDLVDKPTEIWNGSEWSTVIPFKVEGGARKIYKVKLSNGMFLRCSENHRFMVLSAIKHKGENKVHEVETSRLRVGDCMIKFFSPVCDGFDETLDGAYTAGFMTGDGNLSYSRGGKKYPRNQIRLYGNKVKCASRIAWKSTKLWEVTGRPGALQGYVVDTIPPKYFVPHEYNVQSRLDWLAGLLDSDGHLRSYGATISMAKEEFARDVWNLVQGLGGTPHLLMATRTGGYGRESGEKSTYWVVQLPLHTLTLLIRLGLVCTRLNLREGKLRSSKLPPTHLVEVTSIKEDGFEETYCFTEPLRGNGVFNGILTKQCLAVAPTVSNSTISGGVSAGIEPLPANAYSVASASGTFIRKNQLLAVELAKVGRNDEKTWKSIASDEFKGSVQHLDCLSDEIKKVYLTAREINQHSIIKQACQRQKWIDQAQSVNLFFTKNADPRYVHEVHLAAWQGGLKTLYYLRSEGVLKGDVATRSKDECAACEA